MAANLPPDYVKFASGPLLLQCCSIALASEGASLPCWLFPEGPGTHLVAIFLA